MNRCCMRRPTGEAAARPRPRKRLGVVGFVRVSAAAAAGAGFGTSAMIAERRYGDYDDMSCDERV